LDLLIYTEEFSIFSLVTMIYYDL